MDLDLSESELAFRDEARRGSRRTCRASRCPRWTPRRGSSPTRRGRSSSRTPAGRSSPGPGSTNGRGASPVEWVVFEEEYYRAGAQYPWGIPGRVSQNGIFLLSPSLRPRHQGAAGPVPAGDGHRRADLGAVLVRARGRPDLASLRSTARRDDASGGWVPNGQKTWSSRATFAHWGFGLFRSDPEAERHRGLTYFLFPLDADGITVRPIAQLDGEAGFAELFFEDVFVPDADVLGAPATGGGAMSTAGNERAGCPRAHPAGSAPRRDRLLELYRERGGLGPRRPSACAPPTTGHDVVDAWDRPRPTASTPGARSPARRRRGQGCGRLGQQGLLVRARHRPARDGWTCSDPRPRSSRRWLDGYRFRCPGRSTPARTRSSATSLPSGSSAFRARSAPRTAP